MSPRQWVVRWLAGHQFLAACLVFTVLVGGAFWRDYARDQAADARDACYTRWAGELTVWAQTLTARTVTLAVASSVRGDANDRILRVVADAMTTGRSDPTAFRQAIADYVTASDAYRQQQTENPVPTAPTLNC